MHLFVDPAGALAGSAKGTLCKRDQDLVGSSRVQTHGLSLRPHFVQTRAFADSPGLRRDKGGCWGGHRSWTSWGCKLAPSGRRPPGQANPPPFCSLPHSVGPARMRVVGPGTLWEKALMESALRARQRPKALGGPPEPGPTHEKSPRRVQGHSSKRLSRPASLGRHRSPLNSAALDG